MFARVKTFAHCVGLDPFTLSSMLQSLYLRTKVAKFDMHKILLCPLGSNVAKFENQSLTSDVIR
jgi:hypothetical protein